MTVLNLRKILPLDVGNIVVTNDSGVEIDICWRTEDLRRYDGEKIISFYPDWYNEQLWLMLKVKE